MMFAVIFFGLWTSLAFSTLVMTLLVLLIFFVGFPLTAFMFFMFVTTMYKHV